MSKIRRIRLKSKKYFPIPGSSPGVIELSENALRPKIIAYAYGKEIFHAVEIESINELDNHLDKHYELTHWLDIRGVRDLELLEYIQTKFNIHKLVMEDIANIRQRPKMDEYDDYIFAVSRMLYVNADLEIENEQISFIILPKVLISFQENYTDCIDPVIQRLKGGKGNIRIAGTSYMAYSLIDVIVDNYFTLIYRLGDELEIIEELLYRKPDRSILHKIQDIKRAMVLIRRLAWPERDKINDMIRTESALINKVTKTFLKDTYDHSMQIIDLAESYKEMTTNLMDMNLTFISQRMNEIMKVLTIISSVFIPLTFIAGVYGMNFAHRDPETGRILENNMPELYSENGYLYTIGVMLLIAILQMVFFWKKGWLNNQ